jgi:hypothetical protein
LYKSDSFPLKDPLREINSYTVGIMHASEWIPSSASIFDVKDYYNGILLTEMSISDAWGTLQDADANMKAFLDQYQAIDPSLVQEVSINGYFGTAGGNVVVACSGQQRPPTII